MKFEQAYETATEKTTGKLTVAIPSVSEVHRCVRPNITGGRPGERAKLALPAGSVFECTCGKVWRVWVKGDMLAGWEQKTTKRFIRNGKSLSDGAFGLMLLATAAFIALFAAGASVSAANFVLGMLCFVLAAGVAVRGIMYAVSKLYTFAWDGVWSSAAEKNYGFVGHSEEYEALSMQGQDFQEHVQVGARHVRTFP